MICHAHVHPWILRALAVTSAALLLITFSPAADTASAHGSAINPPSRNYDCWKRWGSDFQNPAMATEDPMCWQAWQHDSNAMWNWNGVYREGVGGDHRAAIPDGQLCSAGLTGGDRYASLDVPGAWHTTSLNNEFTFRLHDQALHGADYIRIYVTEQGFDPTTERLGWGDLELVAETGVIPPGEGESSNEPSLGGVTIPVEVSAPGRSGHHIVYMIWQASHIDQSFYSCSDVSFTG